MVKRKWTRSSYRRHRRKSCPDSWIMDDNSTLFRSPLKMKEKRMGPTISSGQQNTRRITVQVKPPRYCPSTTARRIIAMTPIIWALQIIMKNHRFYRISIRLSSMVREHLFNLVDDWRSPSRKQMFFAFPNDRTASICRLDYPIVTLLCLIDWKKKSKRRRMPFSLFARGEEEEENDSVPNVGPSLGNVAMQIFCIDTNEEKSSEVPWD